MSSKRPPLLLVDAASASGLLSHPSYTYVSTVAPKAYGRTTLHSMALVETTSTTKVEQRMPSTRPINQRWDRSRGLHLHRNEHNVIRDLRWSRHDPIIFTDASTCKRGYAQNPNFSPRGSRQPNRQAQRIERDLVRDPNQISVNSIDRVEDMRQQKERAEKATKDMIRGREADKRAYEAQKSNLQEEIQSLKKDIARPALELKTKEDALRDMEAELKVKESELKQVQASLNATIQSRQREADERSQKREAERAAILQQREASLQAKEATLDSKVKEAWSKARKSANQEVEDALSSALEKESDASSRLKTATKTQQQTDELLRQTSNEAKRQKENHEKAMLKTEGETSRELKRYKESIDKDLSNKVDEELRASRKAGEDRRASERYDYEAYHQVWDDVWESSSDLIQQVMMVSQQMARRADYWRQLDLKFNGYDIHSSFPSKYSVLNESLKVYASSAFREAKSAASEVKRMPSDIRGLRSLLTGSSHFSRQNTRFHRFQEMQSNKDQTTFVEQMLTEAPWSERLKMLDQSIDRVQLQIDEASSKREREALHARQTHLENEKGVVKQFLRVHDADRLYEAYKALKQDTVYEKEIWRNTNEAQHNMNAAHAQYRGLLDQNPKQKVDRKKYMEEYRDMRQMLRDYELHVRKRFLLQLHMGESKEDDGRFDADIQHEIDKADIRRNQDLRIAASKRINALAPSVTAVAANRLAPNVVATPARKSVSSPVTRSVRRRLERELPTLKVLGPKIRALETKLKLVDAYPDEGTKQKDMNELKRLRLSFSEERLKVLRKEKAGLESQSTAADSEDMKRVDAGIATEKGFITRATAKSKSVSATSESETVEGGRTAMRTESGFRRLVKQPSAASGVDTNAPTSTLLYNSARDATNSGLNLNKTPAHQARHSFWLDCTRWFHNSAKTNPSQSSATQMSSDDEDRHFHHEALLPQAVFSTRVEGNDTHVKSSERYDSTQASTSAIMETDHETNEPSQSTLESSSGRVSDDNSYHPSDSEASDSQVASVQFVDALENMHVTETADQVVSTTNLAYNIPAEDYRKAVLASKNTNAAFWSYKLYKNAEGFSPTVHYCVNLETTEAQAKQFLNEPVLGFDLEWEYGATPEKSSVKNCVSLIQIASENKIGLFHVALFKGETTEQLIPPSLRAILESSDVTKTGVNISGDALRFEKCFGIKMTGLFELSHLYNVVTYAETKPEKVNRKLLRMADQVQNILLLPLKKGEVRTSAWSKKLRIEQTEYAASDAYAGFRLYHALEAKRKKMDPMPPRPAFWEEHKPLTLGDGTKVVAKKYAPKKKADAIGTSAEEEDDECQEYFDAVEDLDGYQIDPHQTGGVPLSGIAVSYPTLPSVGSAQGSYKTIDEHTTAADAATAAESTTAATTASKPATKRSHPPTSTEVSEADTWAQSWRSSLPAEYKLKVGHATLRAYHLWHEQRFDCKEVAALLRDPPLSLSTVASYVMQALNEENLAYDVERVTEPLGILPKSVHGRYWRIVEKIEA